MQAARDAAEFNEKRWVWVPDEKEGYLAGWVENESDEMGEIIMAAGGEIRTMPLSVLSKMNPPRFDRAHDIADLTFLNEASVVNNLRLRFGSGAIYTYSGLFLVAMNPYQTLPLYSDAIVQQYRNKRRDENPPHIFAVAERAWINMGEERENQSILITGESGAGKTESTKKVIQYLASIATDVHPPTPALSSTLSLDFMSLSRSNSVRSNRTGSQILSAKDRLGLLERQILQANPILEAFGNAQTQRNNNSSRFGKFVRITFAPDGSIAGANIDWYLLEKSRVVVRSDAERSFHVFYQLIAGGGAMKEPLLLDGGVEDYDYLNKSRREVDGVDDKEEWDSLKAALDVVGLTGAEQFDLFRVVAAILHIGNISISSTRSDDAAIEDPSQAERVCHLLGVPIAEFTRSIIRPRVLAGREWVSQARTKQQAVEELASLCKTLYEKSFGHLVTRINQALDRPSFKSTFIGVLDIAGFEIFETNAYEQLLINYTNEKLQQFFNHHMFVLEQEEYSREGIQWDYVNFGLDLQPTIDLIESTGPTIGILSCLDEDCIMPKATDLTFTNKVNQIWGFEPQNPKDAHPGREKYEPSRFEQGFTIQHYAGCVEYRTAGWLEKNKDPLNDNITRVLASSSDRYIAALFEDHQEPPSTGGIVSAMTAGKKRVLKKGAFRTVAQRHKEQLGSLMSQLQATQPHFVRCIVPNSHKRPGRLDVPLVLDQLRCNGVLEGIRIARLGYPNRIPFVEFRQRYEIVTPGVIPRGYMDGRKACLLMVDALELDKAEFKVGTSKIFFKAGVLADLEERRDALLYDIFSRLQAAARMWTARRQIRKIMNRAGAIRTIQRNARVYGELREWPWWQLYTKVRPLLAATRDDEELRKRDLELALIRERAERDQIERKNLENLQIMLETEKRKVEDALVAERALLVDKDTLLQRSKARESQLEEEVNALESDLDLLDSQLDRAIQMQHDSEEKQESLRLAFDEAAEHLVRLESEQSDWTSSDNVLRQQLQGAREDVDTLRSERDELQKTCDELKGLVAQREEDLVRAKERSETTLSDLQSKLTNESASRNLFKSRSEASDHDARRAKTQLEEMTRTATEYTTLLHKREQDLAQLQDELNTSLTEQDMLSREAIELQGEVAALVAELDAQHLSRKDDADAREALQDELDDLRSTLVTKTNEATRRSEVHRSKELELAQLRAQTSRFQDEAENARRSGYELQSKLKVELDRSVKVYEVLKASHGPLLQREQACQSTLERTKTMLVGAERTARSLESELQSLRERGGALADELAESQKTKENLSRQLTTAHSRYLDFEDTVLEMERERGQRDRQFEAMRKQLEAQTSKREEIERLSSQQKSELSKAKDSLLKMDRELSKALDDLKARDWEVKQLKSRQDKNIVEVVHAHVHVLEEAKRVTDGQLREAQEELQRNAAYIRSLENAKTRLTGDVEDFSRETEKERLELRVKAKNAKVLEERVGRMSLDLENEKQAKHAAELQHRRLQDDCKHVQLRLDELAHDLESSRGSKEALERELRVMIEDKKTSPSPAAIQRKYQDRIAKLEKQLEDKDSSEVIAARVKERVDRQHAEIRRLVMQDGPRDNTFRSLLLKELKLADDYVDQQVASQSANSQSPPTPDPRINTLKQKAQALELQLALSDRVRQHLEITLREISADLQQQDGSVEHLQRCQATLSKENERLGELLKEEEDARKEAANAQVEGLEAMRTKFENMMSVERESYTRLDDSRKALLVQQRASEGELEEQRSKMRHERKQLNTAIRDMQDKLEQETIAKNAENYARRETEALLAELQVASSVSATTTEEFHQAIDSYKAKVESYRTQFEQAEIVAAKASRGESYARRALTDLEKSHADTVHQRKAAQEQLEIVRLQVQDLEARLEEDTEDTSKRGVLQKRLAEALEDERARHKKDIEERDFAADQVRKKYQAELAQLSEELQSQRDAMSRLREDNRKVRADYDELLLRHDEEVYSGGAWKKDKSRLETKVENVTKAYEASTAASLEQQSQILGLHRVNGELRTVLDDAEADRILLQKARQALQGELETIKLDHVDTAKLASDRELQKLQLKAQDLERSLEEQNDRVVLASERMRGAEKKATDSKVELGEVRVENSELDRVNALLEKQVKELKVRIVDLETKSYTAPRTPAPSRMVDDLTSQLGESSRIRSDAKSQLAEAEHQRSRMDEERRAYEAQVLSLRQNMDSMLEKEADLQRSKRRAEREVVDFKQKNINLEREVERLRDRLDRPSSFHKVTTPTSSPRK